MKIAALKKRIIPPSFILQKRKRELVAFLPNWKNASQHKIFAENFFADYNIADLQKQATILFARAGAIIGLHELIAENNLRGSFIIEGQNANLQISFTLTPEHIPLIQEYNIAEVRK